MIKQTKVRFKDGTVKTNVRVMISYRPGPHQPPKQKTIKNFGYLEDQSNQEQFWKEVNKCDEESKKGHENAFILTIPKDLKNNAMINKKYNYGYYYLKAVLESLKLKEYFDTIEFKGTYSLYDIFSFLVYERILNPASKRMNMQKIDRYFQLTNKFELHQIYRALSVFSKNSVGIQTYINEQITKLIGREKQYAFYDVTNYYFERDFNKEGDSYLKKGVSKEHQITPIVQFGLFMDTNHIPIAMKVYPGNTTDSLTLKPAYEEVKRDNKVKRMILVADKGLNSSKNIDMLCNSQDGYIVSQILKGKKGTRYHEKLFDPEGYEGTEEFRYKLYEEEYEGKTKSGKKIIRKRKVLLYWSKEDAAYAKKKREEKLLKAEKEVNNNIYKETAHTNGKSNKYVVEQYLVKETGEQADEQVVKIDYEKAEEDERFDGYFCIITSELDYDKDKILEVYRQLSYIEESFRITKSDLETRPMYVTTNEHIEGHLLTCFMALTVIRMIQYKMGKEKVSAERIQKILNVCDLKQVTENVVWLNSVEGMYEYKEEFIKNSTMTYTTLKLDKENDQIRKDYIKLMKSFDIDLDILIMSTKEFNKKISKLKYKIDK